MSALNEPESDNDMLDHGAVALLNLIMPYGFLNVCTDCPSHTLFVIGHANLAWMDYQQMAFSLVQEQYTAPWSSILCRSVYCSRGTVYCSMAQYQKHGPSLLGRSSILLPWHSILGPVYCNRTRLHLITLDQMILGSSWEL